eukprot:CAMPEP_0174358614 /NCGR_PEP_ID=MMETSP0811_2-20130205/43524_1 /TAXON_ID=73025 ORGANISM="Eutreptiella gymnastica-like, Strain CCMP1594" /NCGR_SAMPLE_ID=MMETSP0811_2 /ASSEMBLY_ACC=CAM_ASM_000667 /LENGTH=63 /DNA_ID=CAMNT_0015492529 /DNA_START=66 /DNA_END=253 /DNA_ORIENTATION=-
MGEGGHCWSDVWDHNAVGAPHPCTITVNRSGTEFEFPGQVLRSTTPKIRGTWLGPLQADTGGR